MKPAAVTRKPSLNADAALSFATGGQSRTIEKAQATSGLVPAGDVRLTANIRRDLHKRLKDAAAQRQYETGKGFTIGELIEELIDAHVPESK